MVSSEWNSNTNQQEKLNEGNDRKVRTSYSLCYARKPRLSPNGRMQPNEASWRTVGTWPLDAGGCLPFLFSTHSHHTNEE